MSRARLVDRLGAALVARQPVPFVEALLRRFLPA